MVTLPELFTSIFIFVFSVFRLSMALLPSKKKGRHLRWQIATRRVAEGAFSQTSAVLPAVPEDSGIR